MTELSSNLGGALRARRRAAGLTQAALARSANMSIQTVGLAERGKGRLATFDQLTGALGLLIDGRNLPASGCLGGRLRALRERRALSRRAAARALTVTADTLAKIESGGPGRVETLIRYGALLGAGLYLRHRDERRPFHTHAGNSSIGHTWQTPESLLALLYRALDTGEREDAMFDLDPCSPSSTRNDRSLPQLAPVRARVHFDIEDDGLSLEWFGRCFVNPPYGTALPDWVRKARHEVEAGRATMVIALVPARPDTRWWHENVIGHASVFMLRGRLKFRGIANAAPFPSALIVWGGTDADLHRLRHLLPTAWFVPAAPALKAAD
ncbi:DNA N-6-adenine-methyltransferase [Parvibaculum sp.]|uniref:DNA N-6-adenine-methyltransferase n=1 Tax=Parvibaculum sp. TaxID=2024848 RepID=UPI001DC6110F|nr:DNA N-6-adenine-methyltransferase [Parvibaculum sp.]MBX3489798.1 helix-turn-helix domain-containing protein [Parvibaculum sp.]